VVNPVYRGELLYGRRTAKPGREVVSASVEPLVTADLWYAAQRALAGHRIMAKEGKRMYLLRSLMVCGIDGLHFSGSVGRDTVWYRCNGQLVERGALQGRCPAKSIKGIELEPVIWADVERFLREPGAIIEELSWQSDAAAAIVDLEADRSALEAALRDSLAQRDRMLDVYRRGHVGLVELEAQLAEIERERGELEARIARLRPPDLPNPALYPVDLMEELRGRLDAGLTDEQRDQIVHLLVRRITVHTDVETKPKRSRIVVEYNFPAVGLTCTGIRAGQNYSKLQRVVQL
jgi:hypothetical protein